MENITTENLGDMLKKIRKDLREKLPQLAGVTLRFGDDQGEGGGGVQRVQVTLFGEDMDLLDECAQEVKRRFSLLEGLEDAGLAEVVRFRDTEGDEYAHPLGDMMRHVVNHSSYHRGQAATQLRQLGETPPETDLIHYLLERQG